MAKTSKKSTTPESVYSDCRLDEVYKAIQSDKAEDHKDREIAGAKAALDLIKRVRKIERDETTHPQETVRELASQFGSFGATSSDCLFPASIGRFAIKSRLGNGGFGLVFRAFDPDLGRDVALKIPRPEAIATADLQARFLREGRAAAALAHPNIVPVFESGRTGAVCFLASQFVQGSSLLDWADDNNCEISFIDAANICLGIADGLFHAHQRDISHRDIKPANILVADQIADEPLSKRVKITDFGLAKHLADESERTNTGAIIGTPSYMSPEQAKQQTATISSDIYSVGAVLYWLLTKQAPFGGDSILDTLKAVANQEPVAPRKLNALVPADLEAICLKCLEKESLARYSSAIAFREDLENWLAGRPVSARPIGAAKKAARWIKRNRAVSTLASVIVLGLLVSIIWIAKERSIAQGNLIVAEANLEKAEAAKRDAATNMEYFESSLRRSDRVVQSLLQQVDDRLRLVAGAEKSRREIRFEILTYYQEVAKQKSDDPFVRFDVANASVYVGEIHLKFGEHRLAQEAFEEAIELFVTLNDLKLAPSIFVAKGAAYGGLAQSLLNQQKPHQALAASKKGQKYWGKANNEFELTSSQQCRRLDSRMIHAIALGRSGNESESCSLYRSNLAEFRKVYLAYPKDQVRWKMAGCINNLANSIRRQPNPTKEQQQEAFQLSLEAVAILQALVEKDPSQFGYKEFLARSLYSLAGASDVGAIRDQLFQRALELKKELRQNAPELDNSESTNAQMLMTIGTQELKNGELRSAEKHLQQSVSEFRKLLDASPDSVSYKSNLGRGLNNLGLCFLEQQQIEKSIRCFQEATERQLEALTEEPNEKHRISLGRHYVNLSKAYLKKSDYRNASQTAGKIESQLAEDPVFAFVAAQFYGRCFNLVTEDRLVEPSIRETLQKSYRRRTLGLLSSCIEKQQRYRVETAKLLTGAFSGLVNDREFQELLDE